MSSTFFQKRSLSIAVFAGVLGLFGVIKLTSGVIGSARMLELHDDLLGMQFRILFLVLGGLELALALIMACLLRPRTSALLVVFIAVAFLGYHAFGAIFHVNSFCPCLGSAVDWLPALAVYQKSITLAVACWLCLLALWFLHIHEDHEHST